MAETNGTPFTAAQLKRKAGDRILSGDWNALVGEIERLEKAKVNRVGIDNIAGPLTIEAALQVGSGITQPKAKLEVKGITNDTTGAGLNITDSQSKSLLYVRNDGNVGIGTDQPGAKLQVTGDINLGNKWGTTNTEVVKIGKPGTQNNFTSTGSAYIQFQEDQTGDNNSNPRKGTSIDFITHRYNVGDQNALTLAANGNVGIGMKNPRAKLEVSGEIKANFFKAGQGNTETGRAGQWYRIAQNNGTRASAEFTLRDYTAGGGNSALTFRVGISYNDLNGMSFTVLSHSRYTQTTFTKIRVLQKGISDIQYLEVYVNRTGVVDYSIYDNLHITGWEPVNWEVQNAVPQGYTAREFDVDQLFVVGDYDDRFTISRGGNVGIGTTSPNAKLEVAGEVRLRNSSTDPNAVNDYLKLYADNSKSYIQSFGDNEGLWIKSEQEKVHVDSDLLITGKVGIGTTSPNAKLEVAGEVRLRNSTDPSAVWDYLKLYADGTKSYIQSFGDNEGLWIKSEQEKVHIDSDLHIVGNLNVDGKYHNGAVFASSHQPQEWGYTYTNNTGSYSWFSLWSTTLNVPKDSVIIITIMGHWKVNQSWSYLGAMIDNQSLHPPILNNSSWCSGATHTYLTNWHPIGYTVTKDISKGIRVIGAGVVADTNTTVYVNGAKLYYVVIPK